MQIALCINNTNTDLKGDCLKRTSEKIIQDIKRDKLPNEKKNYTFRINIELMEKFVNQCEKSGVKPTAVLTKLLKNFISE